MRYCASLAMVSAPLGLGIGTSFRVKVTLRSEMSAPAPLTYTAPLAWLTLPEMVTDARSISAPRLAYSAGYWLP